MASRIQGYAQTVNRLHHQATSLDFINKSPRITVKTTRNMTPLLYTFVGTVTAVKYHLTHSTSAADVAALAASDQLHAVSENLLAACNGDVSDERFKALYAEQVVNVLEAVEALRQSPSADFQNLLNDLLEYFYAAADALMGGGGIPNPWPSSVGSVGRY